MADSFIKSIDVSELSVVSAPPSGEHKIYAKSDSKIYSKDSSGTERVLTSSLQDAYNGTQTVGDTKQLSLEDTVSITYKKTVPASGTQFTHRWVDASDVYLGGLYYNTASANLGLNADFGENISATSYGSGRSTIFQGVKRNGVPGATSGVLTNEQVVSFRGLALPASGSTQFLGEMRMMTSENITTSGAGSRWEWSVVKVGTAAGTRYTAMRLKDEGSLTLLSTTSGDFIARNAYKCPFGLYSLPSPYNLTGTAIETKISSNITVPANTLGNNSKIRIDALTSCTTTANAKYLIIRFGPNADNTDPIMLYFNFGGQISQHIFDTLTCLNSPTDKIGFLSYTSGALGTSSVVKSSAMQQISVNNAVLNYITVWMKNGQATDDSTLQMLTLEVVP